MAESNNRRPRTERSERPRTDRSERPRSGSTSGGRTTSRGSSPDGLLEVAEQIEEHARALLARARDLRRMADSGEGAARRTTGARSGGYGGNRAGGEDRPQRRTSERGGTGERSRSPRAGGAGERGGGTRSPRDETPDWAPTPKRRRT
jgi:hypothetical protein